ncbi:MAG: helix-turn-helix transcriptional regulator [Clostridia bacterium]|nr:helix-turn-helix transcriptional regulator [Clostridia bacterium]
MTKPDYCRKLRNLRILNEYTQADIALLLNIRQEQYSKYESGVHQLPIHLLVKLCKLYKVSSDYILNI